MGRNTCLYLEMKRKSKRKKFYSNKKKMTISNSPIILTNTDWIQRNESMALSGNKLRSVKALESRYFGFLVKGWNGLLQNHDKYLTSVDIGRGICRSMGSTLIMNSFFIPYEYTIVFANSLSVSLIDY